MAEKGRVGRAGDFVREVCDRFWLFTIAAIALGVIGFVLLWVVIKGKMPEGAGELLSAAVTGLLMIVQKVIEAQGQRRMADQLAQSSPHNQASGREGDPVHVTEEES